jgi:hypothetical protein
VTASAGWVIKIPEIVRMTGQPDRNLSLRDIELGIYAV